jgi:23S rRNA pseudoU1915 N3-methylase RlmH
MVLKRLREFLQRWRKPHKPSEVEVKRRRDLGADYEETMMAISFAEAGAQEEALEVLRRRGNRKILVLGQEDTFTEPVMEYATSLAERLEYELIALSVGPVPVDQSLTPFDRQRQEEFRRQAEAAAAVLAHKAAPKKIQLTHVVKFGDVAKAVEEINRQYRRIELVITDSRVKREELHARVNLPVFSLKSYR